MLNQKQQTFVYEYLKNRNATQAYKTAYGVQNDEVARANASRLLTNANVKNEINKFTSTMKEGAKVTIEQLVEELTKVAFSDIRKVVSDESGIEFKKLNTLDEATAASISEIAEIPTKYGMRKVVKLHSKLSAIDMLLRCLGGYVPEFEIKDGAITLNVHPVTPINTNSDKDKSTS